MAHYDYLIIGGGVAGMTAAETIRELDPKGSIAIVSDELHPLYSRVLLPKYIRGEVAREKVFLRATDDYASRSIRYLSGESAIRLDASAKTVSLGSGTEVGYGKLLIASGGHPLPLDIPGIGLAGVTRLQTIDDADHIRELISRSRRAVVYGSGFIALEYLDILVRAAVPTALFMRGASFFESYLDAAGWTMLHALFSRNGIDPIVGGVSLAAVEGDTRVEAVRLSGGQRFECDFVGIGIGLRRNIAWLGHSGLPLLPRGVKTDEYLETPLPGIFAAGDVAEFFDPTLGRYRNWGNWTNAFLQGKTAGQNMASPAGKQPFRQVPSYGIRCLGYAFHVVGETRMHPEIQVITQHEPERERYARYFLRGDAIAGAVLINRPEEKAAVVRLVERGVEIPDARRVLADPTFDITVAAS